MDFFYKKIFTLIIWIGLFGTSNSQSLLSPSDFLGYPLGTKFTYHHKVVEYFNYIGQQSENVMTYHYGKTYEQRDLMVAYVSSAENLKDLEKIRKNNLRRAGFISGNSDQDDIAIVWLSYNVHGNEANSTETSMKVLYELINGQHGKHKEWLDNLVIIIDPCLNPDGRDRYVNWYNQVSSPKPNPNINSREHHEGWANGRSNHYLFDLNRDWVWQTQIESKQRLALYNDWMPHIHVDFHEQFPNSQYYFAPAASPMHEHITEWQKEFQEIVGKNNARYFDEKGWLYFTRESFDLLYPGYGDTYPTFNGAIGMTYEMPGHSIAGLSIKTDKGDTLTLNKRIDMHFTTSISTIEACNENRESLIREFSQFFNKYDNIKESYILKSSRTDNKELLIDLLDKNRIIYKSPQKSIRTKGYSFNKNIIESFEVNQDDLIIPLDQPKSTLVKVLFERNTKLIDTLTYDITAWSLPFVYGLDGYLIDDRIDLVNYQPKSYSNEKSDQIPYAYLLNWTSIKDAKFLSAAIENGYKINYSTKGFSYKGVSYSAGTLVINRIDNDINFSENLMKIAKATNRNLIPVYSGSSISSMDLGSQKIKFLKRPKVAMLAGHGISNHNFGEMWYFFEQELKYPIDIIEKRWMRNVDLNKYDILLLASGNYSEYKDESSFLKMDNWVKQGGNLILIENSINSFIGEKKFSLKSHESKSENDDSEKPVLFPYIERERESLKTKIQGSIVKMEIDNTHPLAYGYDKFYYTLNNDSKSYIFLKDGWNVGYITSSEKAVAGFIGAESKDKLDKNLVFGVEQREKGNVIYFASNPIFRGFWQNGKLFLANAIFFNN